MKLFKNKSENSKEQESTEKKSLYFIIRKWFQPYWNPIPKVKKEKNNKNNKKEKKNKNKKEKNNKKSIQPVQQPTQQPVQQTVQQPAQQTVQQPAQQSAQQSDQQPIQQTAQQPAQQSVQQVVQQTAQQPVQQSKNQSQQNFQQIKPNKNISIKEQLKNNLKEPLKSTNTMPQYTSKSTHLPVIHVDAPLDNCMNLKIKPKANEIWFYHDAMRHQVFAHLEPGSGWTYNNRNDEARQAMTTVVKPNIRHDKTHLLPFGYHGSDDDKRLIIGWDSKQNQNEFREFEIKAKKITDPIYWITDVKKTQNGASWRYLIYSAKTLELIDSLERRMNNVEFRWNA